jgi:hypothetical protein
MSPVVRYSDHAPTAPTTESLRFGQPPKWSALSCSHTDSEPFMLVMRFSVLSETSGASRPAPRSIAYDESRVHT